VECIDGFTNISPAEDGNQKKKDSISVMAEHEHHLYSTMANKM